MLGSDLLRKKIKFDGKDTGEPLSYCQFCKAYTIMDLQCDCCQKCGSIVGELDVQADEKFTEKPKYIPHGQTYWGLQRYDAEVSRDYLIRRHIKDLSCKIEIPEFMQRNVETLVKKLINKNPKLAKSLKNIVVSCIFLNMRQKDPAYSIKNFSEVADMKPKTVLKHMNTIKPFFFEDEHIFLSSSQRTSSGNHEAYLLNFVQKLDLKQLLSPESDLGLSLMTIREEHKENLKLERIFGSENILPQQGSTYNSAYKKLEDIIKSKITKYGSFLINSDFLFSTKFGKNVNNFVISLVVVILRAFSIPITMKKLCEIEEVSLISISRMAKDITIKIMDEYMNQLELLSTTQQTFDSTQVSTLSEDKEGDKEGDSKEKEEDEENYAKKSKNDDTLKKAIKLLYKKCPYQN